MAGFGTETSFKGIDKGQDIRKKVPQLDKIPFLNDLVSRRCFTNTVVRD